MKYCKSASNAQGSRLIIVTLQVRAVMEALTKMNADVFLFLKISSRQNYIFYIVTYLH
jgi:hypothetical protein